MKNKKYIFSSNNDEEPNENKGLYSYQTNNKFLNLPKLFKKTSSFSSDKKRHSSEIGKKNFSNKLFRFPKLIKDSIKQYELHPFRQLNLKIIGEDIKHKLFEMNKEDNIKFDYLTIERKSFSSKTQNILKITGYNKNNNNFSSIEKNKNIIKEEKEEPLKIKDDNIYKRNETTKIYLEIPQKFKRKKKKILSNKLIRERKLIRIKNLYDSKDDEESGEEGDKYVINPETKKIVIFDFLILIFFLYYFIFTTFNLCEEKCFCPSNKSIIFSDVLLFINDILCILDLFLSFFRGYYSYDYKLINSNKLILQHYLKYDFLYDLLSAIPIYSIIKYNCLKEDYIIKCFKYEMPNKFLLLKLCSLLKAVKIKKIIGHKKNQALDRIIESFSEYYSLERAFIILIHTLNYIGIFHFFVCLHIFIGNHSYSNWLILTQSEDKSLFDIYVQSLYFIITTLTTVGYGDIVCQSLLERIFQIIILVIGSVFYPYVVSLIGSVIQNDSSEKIKHSNNLNILENIRRNYPSMPFKLYNKIYKYLESKSCSLEKNEINSLIESLPFALKNNILFTMHKNIISDFKFFKNNNNSVFIAEVLNNFVPSISKKNEFIVYEGEMLEEIIFLKDGKIAFNAAINMENPLKSINKYFFESFAPFTTEQEKKLINENINIKSNYSSAEEITYDKAKNKLNNAFNNLNNEKIWEEKSQFLIQTYLNKSQNFDFDVKGGAIINDEGNYQYLKILDIRKNEHFGIVYMTLNKPCPLSLQVKSKLAELFLLKKEYAVNLSKNYPNIWRKIYGKEFHNLRKIKQYTFIALKKYLEINDLFIMNNIDDSKITNNISFFDLNNLEKSGFADKSMRKSKINKSSLSNKEELNKNKTLNYAFDKSNKKINLDKIKVNIKTKMNKKFDVKRNSTYDQNKNINQSNSNKLNSKLFLNTNNNTNYDNKNGKLNKNNIIFQTNIKRINLSEKKEEKNQKEKLKILKLFLIEYKKSILNNNYLKVQKSNINNSEKNNALIPKAQLKKSILKKRTPDNIKSNKNIIKNNKSINSSNKNVAFDLGYNKENNSNMKKVSFNISENILKNLNDICEEETNFSFCSINEENNYKFKELEVIKNSDFEIISLYPNINEITKGKYSKDINFQKKLQFILNNYYKNKDKDSNSNDPIFQTTILPSNIETNLNFTESYNMNLKNKLNNKKRNSKSHNIKKYKKEKYNTFYGKNKLKKINKTTKIQDKKIINKTDIMKGKLFTDKKLSVDNFEINDNLEVFSTLKIENQNLSEKQSKEIFDLGSVKANKSLTSSSPKKSIKEDNDDSSNKNFFDMNINNNSKLFNNTELEYDIDKKAPNFYNDKSNKISNNSIYKKKKKKYKSKGNDKDEELFNKMLGIKMPNSNNPNNIITTSSNLKDNKNDFNSIEKIKNIENVSIYNIIQKNINKNFNIIDKEKTSPKNISKSFCCII